MITRVEEGADPNVNLLLDARHDDRLIGITQHAASNAEVLHKPAARLAPTSRLRVATVHGVEATKIDCRHTVPGIKWITSTDEQPC